MFFILSKVLYFLILPFSWIVILLIFSSLTKSPRWKRRSRRLVFILIILFSNPFLSNQALSALETDPVELQGQYDVGIVLSGILEAGYEAKDQEQVNENFDRLTEAIKLYKQGSIQRILLSGGAADMLYPQYNEGISMMKMATAFGVDEEDLILENRSRNTYENAVYSGEILQKEESKLLLITSAFHMKRASACFEKAGLDVDKYPVDYKGHTQFKWKYMIPSVHAFQNWNIVTKELVGMAVYRLVGYI